MLHEPQKGKIIGLSTEEKPDKRVIAGTHFIEVDTGLTYAWDGTLWREYVEKVGTYLFNTDTGEWEAATTTLNSLQNLDGALLNVVKELKILNLQMSLMTDTIINKTEVE